MQLELIMLGLSILLGFVAFLQSSIYLFLFAFYLLAISLACDAYGHQYTTRRELQGGKQLVRAVLLFILTTGLIFYM